MRNGQNNKRMRNRNNNNNNNNQNRGRGQNPLTRVYESNGPDIKIRGTASHIAEKYVQLARDARSSGDPVAAENYYQHAEHYFRLIAAAQEQFRQNQPQHQQQPRPDNEMSSTDEGDGEDDGFSPFGQEPGFGPQHQQPPQQPYMRDNNQRDRGDQQPYHRDQQPREHRPEREHRDQRPQPQFQPPQPQPQPVVADSVDRLPSFITGPQPQINGGGERNFEGGGGGERYPRRRRRPNGGPRPDNMAGTAPATSGEDVGE